MPRNLEETSGGRWRARVMIRGQDVNLGTHATRELALQALRAVKPPPTCSKCKRPLGEPYTPTVPEPRQLTVSEWGELWMELYPGERNDETERHNLQMTRTFIREYGKQPMAGVARIDAQAWAVRSPGSVRYLRLMWDRAVRAGVTPENPWATVERRSRKKDRRLLTVEDVDRLSAMARKPGGYGRHVGDLVLFAAYSGLRLGEVAGVTTADVLEDGRRVVVRGKRTAGMVEPKMRTVAVFEPGRRALLRQLPDVGRVWGTKTGRALTRDSVWRLFGALCDEAGIDGVTFHSLRRFHATWLADLGANIRDIAQQLGHTDEEGRPYPEMVDRVYASPNAELALQRLERVAG